MPVFVGVLDGGMMELVRERGASMGLRQELITYSKGDRLETFWKAYFMRKKTSNRVWRDLLTFFIDRSAQKHGGYVGKEADFASRPLLPHGLHGIYISRYAVIGKDCWIYQNVTIGEVRGKAPVIGDDCLIGAGAILVGDIHIGNRVHIGAGCVVRHDIPDDATVKAPEPAVVIRPFRAVSSREAALGYDARTNPAQRVSGPVSQGEQG